MFKVFYLLLLCMFISGCSNENVNPLRRQTQNVKGEYIYRQSHHYLAVNQPEKNEKHSYPWEEGKEGEHPKITKEYFRCKGRILNPPRIVQQEKEVARYYDCGGAQKHSLPLKDQKEFIYQILIDLLNHVQKKTGKRVVITCGHACQDHNLFLDSSSVNQVSKHLIGAEVDFYVEGLEDHPMKIVDILTNYYKEASKYKGLKDFEEFKRYEKVDTNVSTMPWHNKEIFIKLFKKNEGRDFDNRHPYPYISVQVRYDWDTKEKVQYSWDKAFHNLHRW